MVFCHGKRKVTKTVSLYQSILARILVSYFRENHISFVFPFSNIVFTNTITLLFNLMFPAAFLYLKDLTAIFLILIFLILIKLILYHIFSIFTNVRIYLTECWWNNILSNFRKAEMCYRFWGMDDYVKLAQTGTVKKKPQSHAKIWNT